MKFSEDEVVDAKEVLCRNSGNLLTFQVRKDSQYRSEKFVHVEDIYDGLKNYLTLTTFHCLLLMDLAYLGCQKLRQKISPMYRLQRKSHRLSVNLLYSMNQ